jgi:hypothetical protein
MHTGWFSANEYREQHSPAFSQIAAAARSGNSARAIGVPAPPPPLLDPEPEQAATHSTGVITIARTNFFVIADSTSTSIYDDAGAYLSAQSRARTKRIRQIRTDLLDPQLHDRNHAFRSRAESEANRSTLAYITRAP